MFNAFIAWRYAQWRALMYRRIALRSLGYVNRFWPEVAE